MIPAIELSHVTKRFESQTAVDDLSLQIAPGTKFGLIGVNGAGKSTSIRMMLGLLRPDAGAARILGRDPRVEPAWCKRRIGYVPEAHLMHRWMTVDQLLGFCRGVHPEWDIELCAGLVKQFGLHGAKRVGALSKGMLAKLSLVIALSYRPPILILDEPTSGLDPIVREDFLEGILGAEGDAEQAVLFSSHILSDVERLADTIGILHEGRLLAVAPTDELMRSIKRVRLVLPDANTSASLPPGVVWQSRDRREWLMTVRDFSAETVGRLRSSCPEARVDVFDLSIEEIFKDFVRGKAGTT